MSDPVSDLKHELLAAAARNQGALRCVPVAGASQSTWLRTASSWLPRRWHRGCGVTPRHLPGPNSPGFLERAEAALTPPTETVPHYRWEATYTSTDPACTVTRTKEIWIDQTPPHAHRALLSYFDRDPGTADPRALACSSGMPAEIGGTLDSWRTLVFEPPNALRESTLLFRSAPDPVQDLRDAISAGWAHHEGKAQLDGRTVERIRMDPPPDCPVPGCERESTYTYVNPETFYPVQSRSRARTPTSSGPVSP